MAGAGSTGQGKRRRPSGGHPGQPQPPLRDIFGNEVEAPRKKRDMRERRLHIAIADFLRRALEPPAYWLHVPNGELREQQTGELLKRMGVKPGVPDLWVLFPAEGDLLTKVLCIEIKPDGEYLAQVQREAAQDLRQAGCYTAVARSVDEVELILRQAGIPLRGTVLTRRM